MLCLFISVLEENCSHSTAEIKDLMHFFPPAHIAFVRKPSHGKDRLYCGHEIYNLDKIHKEMKTPLRKYCGFYDCFFAFVMGWQLCSKSWVVARIFVELFVCNCQIALSGNQTHTIDFCCQELHKSFCFINFYLQKSILLLSLLCQDLVLPLLFWQDQPGSVLPRIMYVTSARNLTAFLFERAVSYVCLQWAGNDDESQVPIADTASAGVTVNLHIGAIFWASS